MASSNPSASLESAGIGKLLLEYSLPAIIGMTVTSLYNIIDSIYIGHGVGALAISGLAISFPLMNLIMAICLLVAVGGSTVCSIELGRGNPQKAALVMGNVLVLGLIFGVAFGAGCLLFLDPILILFGASAETLPYARDFMRVLLMGLPIGYTMLGLNNVMRASGYPQKAMLTALLSVGVNVIVAPLFIFVFHWGIRGAALATVLSQCAALIWIFAHFRRQESLVHFQAGIYRLRASIMKAVLSIGLSPFLMNVCACVVVIIINLSLYRYGGDMAIGAYGIVNRVLMLFVMVVMGLTQGMQPIIGYNFGARKPLRVRKTLVYGVAAGAAVTTLGFLAFQLSPRPLARMFTDSAELVKLSVDGLRLCGAAFFLVGGQIVISAFFQSIGMASVAIFLSLARQLLFLIPGLILLPMAFGLDGVWLSMPVADSLSFIVAAAVLWRSWRNEVNPCGGFGDASACMPPDDFGSAPDHSAE